MADTAKKQNLQSLSTSDDVTDLRMEVRELRQRLDDGPFHPTVPEMTPRVTIVKDPARKTKDRGATQFPKYNGDKSTYPAWRRALLSALKMDWNTFEYTDSYVFLKIYESLEGKAQRQAGAYFESGGLNGKEKPEDFIAFLDRSNWDPTRLARSRAELNEMKMGPRQKWSAFFPTWANKLTEANGDGWPDESKITMLSGTLNQTMRVALASNHLLPIDNYFEWVRIVTHVAHKYDDLSRGPNPVHFPFSNRINPERSPNEERSSGGSNSSIGRGPAGQNIVRSSAREVDYEGDISMDGIFSTNVLRGANGKALRAKWKTPEQIERLRREGKCFRCEQKGCSTRKCRLLPAVNPYVKTRGELRVNFSNLDPDLYEEVDEEGDDGRQLAEN